MKKQELVRKISKLQKELDIIKKREDKINKDKEVKKIKEYVGKFYKKKDFSGYAFIIGYHETNNLYLKVRKTWTIIYNKDLMYAFNTHLDDRSTLACFLHDGTYIEISEKEYREGIQRDLDVVVAGLKSVIDRGE